jgi:hypothetical protein
LRWWPASCRAPIPDSAGGRNVTLASTEHSPRLDPEAVAAAAQTDLVEAGIAGAAREEQLE